MPKRLLRSIIEFDKEVSPENLVRNFQLLRKAIGADQLEWIQVEDSQIYKYLLGYFIQHFEMPSVQTVIDYFQSTNSSNILERIKDIQLEHSYARTNFVNLLRSLQEEQAKIKLIALYKESHEILVRGIEDKRTKEVRKGVDDAIEHFAKESQSIRIIDVNTRIHGDIRQDGDEMREEYALAEMDKGSILGILTGINEIDDVCKGVRKGELWIHAAYPAELKTTLALNVCYNNATRFKKNVVYISFEMPYEQIRRQAYALHSANSRFSLQGYKPLDYAAIRDGFLNEEEKDFYLNHVIPDLEYNPTYTHFETVAPDREWTMDDVRYQIELFHKEFEVGLVVLDHGQWIQPRKQNRNKDYTISLNSVINDAKNLALHFDHNRKVPVLMLFQINRKGKEDADKNDGVYKMNALTYANACEKTADIITTTYLNDSLRAAGITKISCLKNRDNPIFKPFEAHVQFYCRRILSAKRLAPQGFSVETHSEYLESMEAML